MKSHARTGGAVLLLLSLAAFASAVSGHYDWRWGQPQPPWEGTEDISLTDRNGSRAADVHQSGARAIFEMSDHTIWVLPVTNGQAGSAVQPDPDNDAMGGIRGHNT